jgi:hypothetical protein
MFALMTIPLLRNCTKNRTKMQMLQNFEGQGNFDELRPHERNSLVVDNFFAEELGRLMPVRNNKSIQIDQANKPMQQTGNIVTTLTTAQDPIPISRPETSSGVPSRRLHSRQYLNVRDESNFPPPKPNFSTADRFFYQELSRLAGGYVGEAWLAEQQHRCDSRRLLCPSLNSPLSSFPVCLHTSGHDSPSTSSPHCHAVRGSHSTDPLHSQCSPRSVPGRHIPTVTTPAPSLGPAEADADFTERRGRWLREPPPSLASLQRRCLTSHSFRAALSDRLPSADLGLLFTDAAHAVLTDSFLHRASAPSSSK